jgi:hypothetical protein
MTNRTDNEIMFLCEKDLLLNKASVGTYSKVNNFIADWYANDGKEVNFNFSQCWLKVFHPEQLGLVPIWGRHTWRPDNLAMFLYFRFPRLLFPLLAIIYASRIISTLRVRKINSRGELEISTSGKIISYFVCKAWGLDLLYKILTTLVRRDRDLKSWQNVFEIYFPINHYVRQAFYASQSERSIL